MVNVVEEEETRKSVGVPSGKERRRDTDQVAEDRDRRRKDVRNDDSDETQHEPRRPSKECMLVYVSRVTEETDEHELCRCVGVQCPGAEPKC